MSQRTDRVDELLRQEIGRILAKDVQDPHIGFATVTKVETAPDLRHARVWVSVIGGVPERAQALAALDRAMGYVRHELGVRLRLRRIPALHVALDDSAERGTRVLQILEELEQGHDAAGEALADAPLAESLPTPVPRVRREGDAAEPDEPVAPAADPAADAGAPGGTELPADPGAPPAGRPPARRPRPAPRGSRRRGGPAVDRGGNTRRRGGT
jgi:ribosome-binding factor A